MQVSELIALLQQLDGTLEVCVDDSYYPCGISSVEMGLTTKLTEEQKWPNEDYGRFDVLIDRRSTPVYTDERGCWFTEVVPSEEGEDWDAPWDKETPPMVDEEDKIRLNQVAVVYLTKGMEGL